MTNNLFYSLSPKMVKNTKRQRNPKEADLVRVIRLAQNSCKKTKLAEAIFRAWKFHQNHFSDIVKAGKGQQTGI